MTSTDAKMKWDRRMTEVAGNDPVLQLPGDPAERARVLEDFLLYRREHRDLPRTAGGVRAPRPVRQAAEHEALFKALFA